jgi:hypothetical protein
MLHDYHYIFYRISSSFSLKFKADWIYSKDKSEKVKDNIALFGFRINNRTIFKIRYIMIGKTSEKVNKELQMIT